ncbi:tetratricopeptide repeat protein [Niabella hibiscisoli]|uniref:tetratricopeptide repeat protein n=1 Tax=Niabella hibiscisoli TaxID=1825928 RepID=UPI001F0F23EF|nr:tetratricopeptide repeat protein [Niabella hibiscisoli]MCH5717738.1 tetratricopeptide repeat protein [Niabella hibiscisoli]
MAVVQSVCKRSHSYANTLYYFVPFFRFFVLISVVFPALKISILATGQINRIMFTRSCFILMLIVGFQYASAQSTEVLVQKANTLYEQNKREEAKVLYEKAAFLNNADAHFNLAYRYALSGDDRLCHYQQAALRGHSEGMASFLDEAFFRSDDFFKSDPFLALAVYKKGRA